jgi:hypothetical protein
MGDRIETGVPGRLIYPDVPDTLRDRPTLVTRLVCDDGGLRNLELSYLTAGLSWRADYVAELSASDDRLDLSGWVTLNNRSGVTYRDARLQLVAGDVHRVARPARTRIDMEGRALKALAAPRLAEQSLLDYHLYTLERPTTLRENQVKQVALLSAAGIPAHKEYVLRGREHDYRRRQGDLGGKIKAAVFLEFVNSERTGLGLPLPKGILRVYKQDRAGNAQFVGEDRIDHTPKNETVRVRLGDAFDVTANRTQTDFKKIAAGPHETVVESAYRIALKNARTTPVTVKVEEPMPGDWEVVRESLVHRRQDARTAAWQVAVPADGKAVLTYRVRVRY